MRSPILFATFVALVAAPFTASASPEAGTERRLTVRQDPGKVYYWVLPGHRELDPAVFGTPGNLNPDLLLENKLAEARRQVEAGKMPATVPGLLKKAPVLVGLPREWWSPDNGKIVEKNGRHVLTQHTFFPDLGIPVPTRGDKENWFELTYIDRTPEDQPGMPVNTEDEVDLEIEFHDPAGNHYDLQIFSVIMPPLPGYETRGGVMIDNWHHGKTGTGSPLMPKVYNYGAFWAIGRLSINGGPPIVRVTHGMTTEVVRDKNYALATTEELPLKPEDRINPAVNHHTHIVMVPVKPTAEGPVYAPFETAYTVPTGPLKGKKQPYIHLMWEDETITHGKQHLENLPDYLK